MANSSGGKEGDPRQQRLAAALRANLARRKARARSVEVPAEGDGEPDGGR